MLLITQKHSNNLRNLDYCNGVVGKVVLAPILDVLLSKLSSTETGPKRTNTLALALDGSEQKYKMNFLNECTGNNMDISEVILDKLLCRIQVQNNGTSPLSV